MVITPRRMRWVRHATYMEKMKNIYKTLNGNMKERAKLGNLDIDGRVLNTGFGKLMCEDMKWIELSQNVAFVNTVMNIWVK
jgi:hypothetical protein